MEERMEIVSTMVAHVTPFVLKAAVKLGIPDILASQGPEAMLAPSQIVALIPGANMKRVDVVSRILKFLARKKIFKEADAPGSGMIDEKVYGLNAVSQLLVKDKASDVSASAAFLMFYTHENWMASLQSLHRSVFEDHDVAFKIANGDDFFPFLEKAPKFGRIFHAAMFGADAIAMPAIIKHYEGFKDIRRLVDVGGSLGMTVAAIVAAHPEIEGINFDLPHVIADAPVLPGVKHVSGDMFKSVPRGDAILMKTILHDWNDTKCHQILNNCYRALPKNGRLVVIEKVYSDDAPLVPEADMSMLSALGGRERNEQEWIKLISQAGFSSINFFTKFTPLIVVIEASKLDSGWH